MGTGGSLRNRVPGSHRKALILAAALERFSAQGFQATSMAEIAEKANVTKPVIYQHFTSKRELYRRLLEKVGSDLTDAIRLATAEHDLPRERLAAGMTAYFKFIFDNRHGYLLLFGSGSRRDPEFAEVITRLELSIAELVSERVTGVHEDQYRRFIAFSLIGMAQGAARSYIAGIPEEGNTGFENSVARVRARQAAEILWFGLKHSIET